MNGIKRFVQFWHSHISKSIKWGVILFLFFLLFIAEHVTSDLWQSFILRFYYLPIFMGSLLEGLKGGILCAFLATFFSFPVIKQLFPNNIILWHEISLFFIFGILTGFMADKERAEREKFKKTQHLALLGKAAAAIAHELKTPLVVIGGFAKLLLKNFPPNDPNRKKLEIILKETKWMEDMAHGILNFSKPVQLNLEQVELQKFIEEVVNLVKIGNKAQINVRFLTSITKLKVDPDKFKQVLINVLNNAVQVAPDKPVEVTISTRNKYLVFEIKDQGPGIPEEYRDKVFEPFFTTKTRGTGLGLAIVKRIIDAHKGKIYFKSKTGHGTTFVITLPLQPEVKRSQPSTGSETSGEKTS